MTVITLQPHLCAENVCTYSYKAMSPDAAASLHPDAVAALGTFDGVHPGHLALLRETVRLSQQLDLCPSVWTFTEPPLPPGTPRLCTLREKLALFADAGIRRVYLADFQAVRAFTPERFVNESLISDCSVYGVVCGYNFRFGMNAVGTPDMLSALLSEHRVPLSVLPPVCVTDNGTTDVVSSTKIRALLDVGDVERAALYLGRPFSFSLPVVHGKELGRVLGFPTVNQDPAPGAAIPAVGSYSSAVFLDGKWYPAVTNIGVRPSVASENDYSLNAETHIIGWQQPLYGKKVRIYFRRRLRDEKHFSSLSGLREQIEKDAAASLAEFRGETPVPFPVLL